MRHLIKVVILFSLLANHLKVVAQSLYFPPLNGDEWEAVDPNGLGFCADSIQSLYDYLETEETKSFLLLKDGKIVLEKYFNDFGPDSLWFWFSAGKSLVGALAGIAQEEGFLDITDKTSDYLGTGWTSLTPAQEDSILIWHQLTMTSGLDETDFICVDSECLTYRAPAGSRWVYHNGPYALLRDVIENATSINYNIYTNSRIKNKIGMGGFWLAFGDSNFFLSKARDMARFGLLMQNKGTWDGTPVIGDIDYFYQMISSSQSLNPSYGYLWWLNGKDSYIPPTSPVSFAGAIAPDAPLDIYTAAGSQGQYISVSPSTGFVMIRQGGNDGTDDRADIDLHNQIWKRIVVLDCNSTAVPSTWRDEILIAPNPAHDQLNISGIASANLHIELFDLLGNSVASVKDHYQLDVSHLRTGTYFVVIQTEHGKFARKLVVE